MRIGQERGIRRSFGQRSLEDSVTWELIMMHALQFLMYAELCTLINEFKVSITPSY
jgi:hypothetical protein